MSQPVTSSDYCKCFLATAANNSQTTLVVTAPTEPFPTFDVDHTYFYLTIVDAASYAIDAIPPVQREIVKVTAYVSSGTGYSLTVDRAITTTAQTWAAGAVCEIRSCEQFFEDLKGGGTNIQASYATIDDESVDLPNSRQLIAGANVTLTDTGAGGTLTIAANAGSGAPVDATYVTLSTNSTLTQERVLTAGTGISVTDAGANSTVTVANTALGESYVVIGTSATLTAERVLTAGSGISITDGGANSTVTIAATGGAGGTLQSEEFTASGTFNVPAGVSGIWITAIGGGGGGYGTANSSTQGGAGGGGGEEASMLPLTVTPSGTVTVTIGAGGAGGAGGGNDGTDGGTTTVGPFTFLGGKGGTTFGGNAKGGNGGGVGGHVPSAQVTGGLGVAESSHYFGGSSGGASVTGGAAGKVGGGSGGHLTGGAAGAAASAHSGGGGGAATVYGTGGAGGDGDAAGNDAPAGAYGAGGGGAGANTANAGGAGQDGYAVIFWIG